MAIKARRNFLVWNHQVETPKGFPDSKSPPRSMSLRCLGPSVTVQQVTVVTCHARHRKAGEHKTPILRGSKRKESKAPTSPNHQFTIGWTRESLKKYCWWFRNPAITTWDGAKTLWIQGYLLLLSRISEPSTVPWVWLPLTMTTKITAWKINMEPANHAFRKQNDPSKPPWWCSSR